MIVERLLKIALLGSSWVLYVLLGLSVVSLTAALERWLFFRRHHDDPVALKKKLVDSFGAGDLRAADKVLAASPSIEARVVRAGIQWAHGGAEAVGDAIESELASAKGELERGTNLLGTLGNNAPFIGLFGTVIGVIEAFHQLGAAGQNQDAMGSVMAGIAEALIATGVGIFVAIPAVVVFNIVQQKIGEIETNVTALSKMLTAFVKSRGRQEEELLREQNHESHVVRSHHSPATEALES